MRLVRIPSAVGSIVRLPSRAGRVGQNSFKRGQDWTEFQHRQVGLVIIPSGTDRFSLNSSRSG